MSADTPSELFAVADFCLIPIGTGPDPSVAEYVAECARVLEKSGLKYQVRGYGTNLEGPWSAVSQAIHDCHAAVHAKGAPRVATDIRIGTRSQPRTDTVPGEGENERKLRRVQDILGKDRAGST
ncbi:hypothetical protein BC834DRAFT_887030 [Gloeopeniophorella convolvens]|nr:hypothetical protein BC834DRAFT_887030 [Gloeopeniophorella convolvens]